MSVIKFTVIIPTRERASVLKYSLQSVLLQDYPGYQVLVSDNFSSDNTAQVVTESGSSRVVYRNPGRRLSMSENWEFALSHVSEGWVTILGDDDGLLPDALAKVAGLINRHRDVGAIISANCDYEWPSLPGATDGGILDVPLGRGVEKRNSKLWLEKVLSGGAGYFELPMLYTGGFVSMQLIKRIREKSGKFYHSSIPDVYSAIAVASQTNQFLYVNEPLAVNGRSKHSTGAAIFAKSPPRGSKSPFPMFVSEKNIPFHPSLWVNTLSEVPASVQLMVFECFAQSEHLRLLTDYKPSNEQILETVLRTGARDKPEIFQWGKKFALANGFDFDAIAHKAVHRSSSELLQEMVSYRFKTRQKKVLAGADRSIPDVASAAKLARVVYEEGRGEWREALRFQRAQAAGWLKVVVLNSKTVLIRSFRRFLRSRNLKLEGLKKESPFSSDHVQFRKLLDQFEVDLVVDVGASQGQFGTSLRTAGFSGRILSFEPRIAAHEQLSQIAAADKSWEIFPRCALGERDGEAEIFIAGNSQSPSLLPMLDEHLTALPESAYIGSEKVLLQKADSVLAPYLAQSKMPFLKIDAQGYEHAVLDGAEDSLKKILGLLCRLSLTQLYTGQKTWVELVERLEGQGFSLWTILPCFTDPKTRRMLQMDAIFFRKQT